MNWFNNIFQGYDTHVFHTFAHVQTIYRHQERFIDIKSDLYALPGNS